MSGVSWVSVAGKPREEVLAEWGLADSGEPVAAGSVPVAGARGADGSVVLVFNEFWPEAIHPESLSRLKGDGLVVGCSQAENVNTSLAFLFRGGKPIWTVSHILDEGPLHLSIEGTPPRALAGLMAEARQRQAAQGHDAVFSVPGALAEQVSGFAWARRHELRFTRLDALPKAPPLDARQVDEEILACVQSLVKAEGFEPKVPGNRHAYTRCTPQENIDFYLVHYADGDGHVHFDAKLLICVQEVQSFMDELEGFHSTETARTMLSKLMSLPSTLKTPADLAALLALLRRELPGALRRACDVKELDRVVNDGSPRFGVMNEPTLSHYDTSTGLSRIILAYLAGNPRFDQMVRETDEATFGGANPNNAVHKLVALLKKRGLQRP